MKRSTAVTLKWVGGKHTFDLGHPFVLREFEGVRGLMQPPRVGNEPITFSAVFTRFREDRYSINDIVRVLAWGLRGGDEMGLTDAIKFVEPIATENPIEKTALPAWEVLSALFVGASKPVEA